MSYVRQKFRRALGAPAHEAICPATGGPLYLISDPVHLYKKLRNQLLASFPDDDDGALGKRCMMWKGHFVTWKHIIAVFDVERVRSKEQSPYAVSRANEDPGPDPHLLLAPACPRANRRAAHTLAVCGGIAGSGLPQIIRLEKDHVYPSSWSKMRVDHCARVMSKEVANALEAAAPADTIGTVVGDDQVSAAPSLGITAHPPAFACTARAERRAQTYIRNSQRIYYLLHSRKWVTSVSDKLFVELKEIVQWFDAWREDLIARDTSPDRTQWKKQFISDKTYQDLHWAVDGVIAMLGSFFADHKGQGAEAGTVRHGPADDAADGARPDAGIADDAVTPARRVSPRRHASAARTPQRAATSTAGKAGQHRRDGVGSFTANMSQNRVENSFSIIRQRSGGSVNAMQHAQGVAGMRALQRTRSSRHKRAATGKTNVGAGD